MPDLTINIVSYQRYDETRRILDCFLSQTNQNFVIDFWNDGIDDKKRQIIESYNLNKIKYSENESRMNLYGHDMRQKSCLGCATEYWCTTNDDNTVSPYFVERVLQHKKFDIIKIAVGMTNWINYEPPQDNIRVHYSDIIQLDKKRIANDMIARGVTDYKEIGKVIPVLLPNINTINNVDAASFIVRTDLIKNSGGWDSFSFEGDGIVFEKLCLNNPSIKYINDVLVGHN